MGIDGDADDNDICGRYDVSSRGIYMFPQPLVINCN